MQVEASFLSYQTIINQILQIYPILGCEDFYDEKAKQKKADLAESLGTDVGDKVHFHDKVYFQFSKNCK
jgi:hypothetical protein